MNEYEQRANDWSNKWGVTMTARKLGHFVNWEGDTDTRDMYEITLSRDTGGEVARQMVIKFGQSLANSRYDQTYSVGPYWRKVGPRHPGKEPTMYDVIACLQKYAIGTFGQFCREFGYDTDSRRALDVYMAVSKEATDFAQLCDGDSAMMEEAQEIN